MRRWFEFGCGGPDFLGPWEYYSDRWGGQYPARFVSMPHKEILFEWLNAMVSANLGIRTGASPGVQAYYVVNDNLGTPPLVPTNDPQSGILYACDAFHIGPAYSTQGMIASPVAQALFGPPIFTENGTWTGDYGPGLLEFHSEPPDKFGG